MSDKKDNAIKIFPPIINPAYRFEVVGKNKDRLNILQFVELCTAETLLSELAEGTDTTVRVDMFQPVATQARITVESKNIDFSNNKRFKEAVEKARSVEVVQNDGMVYITILFDILFKPLA